MKPDISAKLIDDLTRINTIPMVQERRCSPSGPRPLAGGSKKKAYIEKDGICGIAAYPQPALNYGPHFGHAYGVGERITASAWPSRFDCSGDLLTATHIFPRHAWEE